MRRCEPDEDLGRTKKSKILRTEEASIRSGPPSPLYDWTQFKSDMMTETKFDVAPLTPHVETNAWKDVFDIQPRFHIRNIPVDTFRTAYAVSALVRVLVIVNTLTPGAAGRTKGILVDGPTTLEMLSSVGVKLMTRDRNKVSVRISRKLTRSVRSYCRCACRKPQDRPLRCAFKQLIAYISRFAFWRQTQNRFESYGKLPANMDPSSG
jgi:hypothetical protein